MMDIHESAQEFRHLAVKSMPQSVSDVDEMVLTYSDSDSDHSSKVSKNENLKEALDMLDKDSPMDAADDKLHNGAAAFSETSSNDKQNDASTIKPEYFQTSQNEDVEKLSLLDRFLSSEVVVQNGKDNITELIGDELIDEPAGEVIDENALLDEIANDLDQDVSDEECLLDDDITEIEENALAEVTSSNVVDESLISHSDVKENVDIAENGADEKSDTVIEESANAANDQSMDVDDNEIIENDCKPDSTVQSTEKDTDNSDQKVDEKSIDTRIHEPETESAENSLKIDDDNDNNLLEEMVDSPRNSEHESMTSELLEKDDTVTRDSNDDEKMEPRLVESSNENSNQSENGAMPENSTDDVKDFKHDAEIHIMDENSVTVESLTSKTEFKDEEMDVKNEIDGDDVLIPSNEVKDEEVSSDATADQITSENLEKSDDESLSNNNFTDTAQSPEPPCKRKSDEEIEEPENKKKRVEEVPSMESVGSPDNSVSDGNAIDVAETMDDNVVAPTVDIIQKEGSDNNKDDDDDVLIVGETEHSPKSVETQSSSAAEIQQPVQKAKILILDTQAIAKDLCEETEADEASGADGSIVSENDAQVSSSQKESSMEKEVEPPVEVVEKTTESTPKAPTTLTLDPAPQKSLCPTAFSLNFVRKFQKNFDKMTRNDLEELLIQKCVEVIVHKSDYADMRNKIEKQESKLQSYSAKYQELSKQYRDLEMVHQRVIKDLEAKNQGIVTPVKITRAVGLQVSLPRKEITVQKPPPPAPHAVNNLPNIASQNAALAKNRRKLPLQRPNEPNVNAQQQQQQQIHRQNMMLARRNELQQRNLYQQQQQQQQGQNNLLKQQLIQNTNPNNLRQQANIRKPTGQFSPVVANQMQNASPKTPASAERQRVPPVILKKMTPTRMAAASNSSGSNATAVYSSQSKLPNTSITRTTATTTSMNNLIDLTDEEDSKRVASSSSNPPALVAIPNNQGNKMVVGQGKVNFVTLKPGTPQAQLQMAQQNRLAAMQKVGGNYVPIAPKSNGTTGQIVQLRKQQPATTLTPVQRRQHPAPLPYPNNQPTNPYWKLIPPRPIIRIKNIESGIVISWTMDEMTDKHAEVASYQIYAYQETSAAPSPETWRHVGDVKAMLLPMAVTLTQFQEGQRYHFAVRAVDEHSRFGIFSLPKTWT